MTSRPSIARREGLLQERNESALAGWVDQVLAENPDEAARFRAGDKKLLGRAGGTRDESVEGPRRPESA